jgi:hypothetical protein
MTTNIFNVLRFLDSSNHKHEEKALGWRRRFAGATSSEGKIALQDLVKKKTQHVGLVLNGSGSHIWLF